MYPQHFVDLGGDNNFVDPKSLLSSPTRRAQSHTSTSSSTIGAAGNVDLVLYNNLVEIFPLVESLIDRKASNSFMRRGSVIYTKTPSRDKKTSDPKGRYPTHSIPAKKKKEQGDKDQSKDVVNNQDAYGVSIFSSRALATEKDLEELVTLKEQVEDLQRKLLEKDELLKSSEISKNQINVVHTELDELKHQVIEKDSLIKSAQLQLSEAKIKLADKQAALEKIQWEAMTSHRKVEKLKENLDSLQGDISSFMRLFEGLANNDSTIYAEDYDVKPRYLDPLPDIDNFDDKEMQKMEEARQAYVIAVAAAKEKQDEVSIAAAASARLHLQSFLLKNPTV